MNEYYYTEYIGDTLTITGIISHKIFCYHRNTPVKIPSKPFIYTWNDLAQSILKGV